MSGKTFLVCCGILPRWWKKTATIMACAQIVLNVLGMIGSSITGICGVQYFLVGQYRNPSRISVYHENGGLIVKARPGEDTTSRYFIVFVFICIFCLIMCLLGAVFGWILLMGLKQNNRAYLRCWIVYTTICWFLGAIAAISFPSVSSVVCVIASLALLSAAIFIVWLVMSYMAPSPIDSEDSSASSGGGWELFLDDLSPPGPAPAYSALPTRSAYATA